MTVTATPATSTAHLSAVLVDLGPDTIRDSSCFRETRAKTADVITLDPPASDHVVPAGHRLALIIAGTEEELIDPPSTTPTLTIDLRRTSAKVPLVGGAAAFRKVTTCPTGTPPASVLDGVRDPSRAARIPGGGA